MIACASDGERRVLPVRRDHEDGGRPGERVTPATPRFRPLSRATFSGLPWPTNPTGIRVWGSVMSPGETVPARRLGRVRSPSGTLDVRAPPGLATSERRMAPWALSPLARSSAHGGESGYGTTEQWRRVRNARTRQGVAVEGAERPTVCRAWMRHGALDVQPVLEVLPAHDAGDGAAAAAVLVTAARAPAGTEMWRGGTHARQPGETQTA